MKAFTNSIDGLPRITVKLEARLSLWDMAVLYTNSIKQIPYLKIDQTMEEYKAEVLQFIHADLNKKSKTAILNDIREEILMSGIENPHYAVSDGGFDDAAKIVQDYLAKKFEYSHVEISEG